MRITEIAIFTDNVNAMTTFYERLLGVPPVHRGEGIAVFRVGDVEVLLHKKYKPGTGDVPCENHTAFAVQDVDNAATELAARGLKIEIPPRDYAWGRSAYLRDPDGNLLEIHRH